MLYYKLAITKQLLPTSCFCLLLSTFFLFPANSTYALDNNSDDPLNFYETAVALEDIGDYESATEYYLTAIKLYLNIDEEKNIVPICERLANLALFMGEYEQAVTYLNSAYLIVESDDPSKAAHLLTYLEKVCLEGEISKEELIHLSYGPLVSLPQNKYNEQFLSIGLSSFND